MRILIAEDNEMNQQLMLMYVHRLGWDCELAGNGIEVIDACRRSEFDVILMDIDMPVLDGIEAALYIRIFDPNIPIIAITAYADDQMRDDCARAGMNAFITKPASREEIEAVINECIAGNQIRKIV